MEAGDKEVAPPTDILSLLPAGSNYRSFEEAREHALPELERVVSKGYARRYASWDALAAELGPVAVSKLACIVKTRTDGSIKARVVTDLRRSGVNRCVQAGERIVLPRGKDVVADTAFLLHALAPDADAEAMVLDFSDAFHTLPVHPEERKFGVAQAFDGAYLVFDTVVFGGEASPLLWGRAAAFLMRSVQALFATSEALAECYVDDPIVVAAGSPAKRRRTRPQVVTPH